MVGWLTDVVTYRERGAYQFSAQQRKSYALICDVKILSYVGTPNFSLKSNPPKGFWGNATIWEKATPRERIQVEFPVFRLLNVRNDAVSATYNALAIAAADNRQVTDVGELVEFVWGFLVDLELTPQLKHREKVIKFVGLPDSQFEFIVHWLPFGNPDGVYPDFNDDPPNSEGDEYYAPQQNPVDDPYAGNPQPSDFNPNRPIEDYGDQNAPSGPFTGNVTYEFFSIAANAFVPNQRDNLEWPGQLVASCDGSVVNSICWLDDSGVTTTLVGSDSIPAQVRFVQFNADNGQTFIPDPNSLSDG